MPITKISGERAGHRMIERQRRGASVRSRRPAAHGAVVVGAQQVVGGLEGGGPRWVVKGSSCGTRRGTPLHVTAGAPWASVVHGGGPVLRALRWLLGALFAVQVAVGANARQRRVCLPVHLGRWQRAGGDAGGGGNIFIAGDNGVHRMRSKCAWGAGACIVVISTWLLCCVDAWLFGGLRFIYGNCRAGLERKCVNMNQKLGTDFLTMLDTVKHLKMPIQFSFYWISTFW